MNKYYAGIGSRQTPKEVLDIMHKCGAWLARKGFILRSGAAQGADSGFEKGCDSVNGYKEIYLPWKGFQNSNSNLIVQNQKAFDIAREFHPYWHNLKQGARKLQARNSHQVLGKDLNTPSEFVLCYTKNGKGSGGAGQAIRIAEAYSVPVFDMGKYNNIDELKIELSKFLKEIVKGDK